METQTENELCEREMNREFKRSRKCWDVEKKRRKDISDAEMFMIVASEVLPRSVFLRVCDEMNRRIGSKEFPLCDDD